MAKKQIRHLMVKITTDGANKSNKELKEVSEGIESINKQVTSFTKRAVAFNKQITGMSKRFATLAKHAKPVASAMQAMNKAMNGNTKTSDKQLSGRIDQIQLMIEYMRDLEMVAKPAAASVERVFNSAQTMQLNELAEGLQEVTAELRKMSASAESTEFYTSQMLTQLIMTTDQADVTEEQLESLGLTMKDLGKKTKQPTMETDKFNNSLRRLNKEGSQSKRSFSKLVFGMNPLVAAYASIAVNVYAVSEAFRVLNEAANLNRLVDGTAQFSSSISGINVKALAQDLQTASQGALNFRESMTFATRGVAFNFTADQLNDLAEGARKASVALGRDFADSMDRVLRGISKQEIELFDELGVVTRLTPAFESYANAVDKSVDELSDYERQLALTIEVQRQLDQRFSSVDATITPWERLRVSVTNFIDDGLMRLADTLGGQGGVVSAMADFFEVLTPAKSQLDKVNTSLEIFNEAIEAGKISQAARAVEEYDNFLKEAEKNQNEFNERMQKKREMADLAANAITALSIVLAVNFAAKAAVAAILAAKAMHKAFLALGSLLIKRVLPAIAALLTPAILFKAVIAAVAGVVAYSVYQFLDFLGVIDDAGKAMSDFSDRAGKYMKQAFDESALGSYRDKVKGMFEDYLIPTVDDAGTSFEEANKTLLELRETLNSKGWELQITDEKVNNEFKRLRAAFIAEHGEGVEVPTLDLMEQAERNVVSTQIGAVQQWENSIRTTTDEINKLAKETRKADNPLKQLIGSFKSLEAVPKQINNVTGTVKKVEEVFMQLKDRGILPASASMEEFIKGGDLKGFSDTLQHLGDQMLAFDTFASHDKGIMDTLAGDDQEAQLANMDAYLLKVQNLRALMERSTGDNLLSDRKQELALLEQTLTVERNRFELELRRKNVSRAQKNEHELHRLGLEAQYATRTNLTSQVELRQRLLTLEFEELETKYMNSEMTSREVLEQMRLLGIKQQVLSAEKEQAKWQQAANNLGDISGLAGLSNMQSSVLSFGSQMTEVYANMSDEQKKSMSGLVDYFKNNHQAFIEASSKAVDIASSIYQAMSQSRITAIDAEIEAERKRDGKSKESLAKIKSLNAKKIKEELKARQASIGMSTATAIMQTMATVPFPANVAMSAAVGLLGAVQMSQAAKAANGQLASLNADTSSLKITGGSEANRINTDNVVGAGEYTSLNGRSGGGSSMAGKPILVGERGPEVVTPEVPVNVNSAGSSSSGGDIVFSPTFNAQAIDSEGMEELFQKFGKELFEGLEGELNAQGRTLYSIE